MAYEFAVQPKDGYILLAASGVLESSEDLILLNQSLREIAARFKCRRFLIDERAGVKKVTAHDLIVFSESRMDTPRPWMRMAILYSPEMISQFSWIETVLQNRSVPYKQFSSYAEAEQWLLSSCS